MNYYQLLKEYTVPLPYHPYGERGAAAFDLWEVYSILRNISYGGYLFYGTGRKVHLIEIDSISLNVPHGPWTEEHRFKVTAYSSYATIESAKASLCAEETRSFGLDGVFFKEIVRMGRAFENFPRPQPLNPDHPILVYFGRATFFMFYKPTVPTHLMCRHCLAKAPSSIRESQGSLF